MLIRQLEIGYMDNFCYIVGCQNTRKALVIDPGADVEQIVSAAKKENLNIVAIVNTHAHGDHTAGNAVLKALTGAKIFIHALDASSGRPGRWRTGPVRDSLLAATSLPAPWVVTGGGGVAFGVAEPPRAVRPDHRGRGDDRAGARRKSNRTSSAAGRTPTGAASPSSPRRTPRDSSSGTRRASGSWRGRSPARW